MNKAKKAGSLYWRAVESCEKALVETALRSAEGNQEEAAQVLGLHATQLRRLARRFGLD